MLDPLAIDKGALELCKRALRITWNEETTNLELWERMCRAEFALNEKLGCEADYFSEPSHEQALYLSYLLYAWNGVESDFDAAYQNDILQIRAKLAVAAAEATEDDEGEDEDES